MVDSSLIVPQRTFLGLAPKELSMVAHVQCVMQSNSAFNFDLLAQGEDQKMTTVQAVYIDNSANNGRFTLRCNGSLFPVFCNPFSVGMFPLAPLTKLDFTASHALADANVDIWLHNVPQPYFQYQVT